MTRSVRRDMAARLCDKRGVALPLALVGLLVTTLLITTVLLTSSTELAVSSAHREASSDLYTAEAGTQRFLAAQFSSASPFSFLPGPFQGSVTVGEGAAARQVRIDAVQLQRVNPPAGSPASLGPDAYVSVAGTPLDANSNPRGRTIGSLVHLTSTLANLNLKVNSGLTVATDLKVGGSSQIIDRSDNCADTLSTDNAILHAAGTSVDTAGNNVTIAGDVEQSALSGAAFRNDILGGRTIDEYAKLATIKFGPQFDSTNFVNGTKPKSPNTSWKYDWGCPASIGYTCPSGSRTTHFPVIAIDASQLNNKMVDLQGDYGQGILIVVNGHLKISGNFVFSGIILVEGAVEMYGTGDGTKVEGAIAGFGEIDGKTNQISETSGNAMIRYNRCMVNKAVEEYNKQAEANPTWTVPSNNPTIAWYEVVR